MQQEGTWKGLVALATVLVASVGLAACGSADNDAGTSASTTGTAASTTAAASSTTTSGGDSDKHLTIGWVPPTVAPFEKAMRAGIQEQAKKLGMDMVVAGGQFDPKVQITAVDSLVNRDVDAIIIWPLDERGIQPALDRAREKHIPIVTIDAPNGRADVNFQTDDEQATANLAKYAAEKIGKPCKVAIIEGVEQVSILKARNTGYANGATEAGCEILDKQTNSNDTPEKAGEIAQTWKTRFGGELGGILAVNDPSALAAAAQSSGDFKPVVVGLNGDAEMIEAIKQGRTLATAALQSPEIGNGMAFAAHELIEGNPVPKSIAADYFQVDDSNIGTYKSYAERLSAPMTVSFEGDTLNTELGS